MRPLRLCVQPVGPAAGRAPAFTLIEMLVVISIMGILAALVVPAIKNFGKSEAQVSATRQLLDDVARARQLAISRRTTVYMVFLPANFWNLPGYASLDAAQKTLGAKLYDKQLNSYTFVTLRSVGDQPGDNTPRYFLPWRTLPEGTFIAPWKFNLPTAAARRVTDPPPPTTPILHAFDVYGFDYTNSIPFPSADAPVLSALYLPYVAFNSLGQLESQRDEYIPLARGTLAPALDVNKVPQARPPFVEERPAGNSTNAFNLIHIEWLTGRARVERLEVP